MQIAMVWSFYCLVQVSTAGAFGQDAESLRELSRCLGWCQSLWGRHPESSKSQGQLLRSVFWCCHFMFTRVHDIYVYYMQCGSKILFNMTYLHTCIFCKLDITWDCYADVLYIYTLAGQKLCLLSRPTAKPFPPRILLSTWFWSISTPEKLFSLLNLKRGDNWPCHTCLNRSGTDQVMTQTFNRRKLSSYWSVTFVFFLVPRALQILPRIPHKREYLPCPPGLS